GKCLRPREAREGGAGLDAVAARASHVPPFRIGLRTGRGTGWSPGAPCDRADPGAEFPAVPRLQRKSFSTPDEVRRFPLGMVDVINLDETVLGRFALEPGW